MRSFMSSFVVLTVYFAMTGSSFGQTALSSCNPATGLTPSGQQCVSLTRVEPTQYQTQISGAGAENYNPVSVRELAETYQCNPSSGNANNSSSAGGVLLIEDCGQPLDLDPATFKEFVGYSGAPAPAPAPAPVVTTVAPPISAPVPVVPAATPPLYAAVPFQAAGLSNTALAVGAVGAAALVGLIAVAANDDDDNSSTSTTTGTN